jgi:hypothetical protein
MTHPALRLSAPVVALTAGLGVCAPALADAQPGILTYELFEETVPHVDLMSCPAEFDADTMFCRAVLTHADMHVFVFAYDGDSPFVASRRYPADRLDTLFE